MDIYLKVVPRLSETLLLAWFVLTRTTLLQKVYTMFLQPRNGSVSFVVVGMNRDHLFSHQLVHYEGFLNVYV